MSAYCGNVTNSDSYWYQRRRECEEICIQKKFPTGFFSISCADLYWRDLHRLMLNPSIDKKTRFVNSIENAPLVDWYFCHKLTEFLKVFLDDILDCDWRYHRYEDQWRKVVHAHGLFRLKNDPGLILLTKEIYTARLLLQKKISVNLTDDEELMVVKGEKAEIIINIYLDTLISSMNPLFLHPDKINFDFKNIDLHPCSIDLVTCDNEAELDHYIKLIQCTQIHDCERDKAFCCDTTTKKCRFHFPIATTESSNIQFEEKKTALIIKFLPKRNDPYINQFVPLIAIFFLANHDLKPILDYEQFLKYVLKYTNKCNIFVNNHVVLCFLKLF
jgi:hypothetical protein